MANESDLRLPADLVAFLRAGLRLEYPAGACDAGQVELLPLAALRAQLFPYDTQGTPLGAADPYPAGAGCYLVTGVSLIASTEDYEPTGLLLWLPDEGRYGTWDDSHTEVRVFGERVTWPRIVADPARLLNRAIIMEEDEAFPQELLVPWPRYRFRELCGRGPVEVDRA